MQTFDLHAYKPRADLLKDRVILITGAEDGIGRAVALGYAAHGATVVVLGKTVAKLETLYDVIVQADYPEPAIYPMDLLGAQPDDYWALAERVQAEFGHLDGLLHNAARLGTLTPIEHYDPRVWVETLQVNLTAPFFLTRACLPLIKRSPDASIIFTSADVGRKGRAYWGAYAVSKFGLEGLMQILADELEQTATIRINSIDPGPVRTRLRAQAYPAEDPNKLPAPEAILGAYLFLMGPDSQDINGEALAAQAG